MMRVEAPDFVVGAKNRLIGLESIWGYVMVWMEIHGRLGSTLVQQPFPGNSTRKLVDAH
jgi:hypothetical protein